MLHEIKCWPQYFERLLDGTKTFEVRRDDRGYQTGDSLLIREWEPPNTFSNGRYTGRAARYTGRAARFTVGFIFRQGVGVDLGSHVVMSLLRSTEAPDA